MQLQPKIELNYFLVKQNLKSVLKLGKKYLSGVRKGLWSNLIINHLSMLVRQLMN